MSASQEKRCVTSRCVTIHIKAANQTLNQKRFLNKSFNTAIRINDILCENLTFNVRIFLKILLLIILTMIENSGFKSGGNGNLSLNEKKIHCQQRLFTWMYPKAVIFYTRTNTQYC